MAWHATFNSSQHPLPEVNRVTFHGILDAIGSVIVLTAIMDTARLEHGLFTLTPQVVDLVALARDTAATVQTHEGEIEVRAPDELPVELDP